MKSNDLYCLGSCFGSCLQFWFWVSSYFSDMMDFHERYHRVQAATLATLASYYLKQLIEGLQNEQLATLHLMCCDQLSTLMYRIVILSCFLTCQPCSDHVFAWTKQDLNLFSAFLVQLHDLLMYFKQIEVKVSESVDYWNW